MRILFNKETFDPTKFGDDDKIIRESALSTMQFNPRSPAYVYHNLKMHELEDETDYLQMGQTDESEYVDMNTMQQLPSSWTDNLVDKPDG